MKSKLIIAVLITCRFLIAQVDQKDFTFSIKEKEKKIILLKLNKPIMIIDSIKFNFIAPSAISVKEKTDNKIILTLDYRNIPDVRKVETNDNYTVDLKIEKIFNGWHLSASPNWARHVTIYLKDLNEHFYGICANLIPDNQKNPDLRGSVQSFDVYGEDSRYFENYASAWSAFYFCNLGYASFINTFAKGEYKFAVNSMTEIYHHTGKLDWYLFTGGNGDEIMAGYYNVIGAPKYVPGWACGPTIWRDENKGGKDEILDDVKKFTELKIPFTSLFVDRPYSDGNHSWSKMNFSSQFSSPEKWISKLKNDFNVEFMTWIASASFGDEFPGTLPGYYSYFDLTNPISIAEFSKRLNQNQYVHGVKGHKMDRADEHFPVSELWKDNTPEWERRNKYIYLYAKVTDSILSAKWGKDNFNFARSAMHGTQKYLGAVWGGDSRASWDGMAANLANGIRSSFIGFSNWGSDVGGYLGDHGMEPEKLFTRWLQFGLWSGLFEIKIDGPGGKGNDRAPWHYGESLQNNFRKVCEERLALAPYIYSQLNTAKSNGVVMKPLAYSYMNDPNTYSIWDEYLFGSSFIVGLVYNEKDSRKIYLPEGNWYDWYSTTTKYTGKKVYDIKLSDNHLPVFVKENSLFVTGKNWLNGNNIVWEKEKAPELVIHAFPGSANFSNSFSYIDYYDNDETKNISVTQRGKLIEIDIPFLGTDGSAVIHNIFPIGDVILDGKPVEVSVNKTEKSTTVRFTKGAAHKIVLTKY